MATQITARSPKLQTQPHSLKERFIKKLKTPGFRLFLLIIPFLIFVFIFSYYPLYGWRYAFYNYKPGRPLEECEFVGLKYFLSLFRDSYTAKETLRVLKNTLAMSFLGYLFSPLPMIFAIFLSEIKCTPFKKAVQTLTTLPNFISWVLVYAVAFAMFSVGDGFVNRILIQMGVLENGINFLASPNHIWIKMYAWHMWKSLGWSSIIYIASISGIDQELYEAATVDGANRFGCIWHITIPSLIPTYFVLLILSIANFINTGMEQYYLFQNAMNKSTIEVLDLYVYNRMMDQNYSFGIAVGILKSLVSITMLFAANRLSKSIRGESVF